MGGPFEEVLPFNESSDLYLLSLLDICKYNVALSMVVCIYISFHSTTHLQYVGNYDILDNGERH